MNNPVVWFEIYVQDMARAKAFYQSVFDVVLTRLEGTEFEMWGFPAKMDGYGTSGALIRVPGYPSGANSVIVYFSCADCAIEADKAVKCGGRLETAKKSIGQYGHMALIVDTEGNMVGLHSMK
jgi:uncharacterized protein